jgi:hypothetical protein
VGRGELEEREGDAVRNGGVVVVHGKGEARAVRFSGWG